MANKQRGLVEIELDGKKYTLKYDLNSLAELEDKLGVPISKLSEVEMGLKQVRSFLWAGLLHENENITEREVGALVAIDSLPLVNEKIGEAFSSAVGKN